MPGFWERLFGRESDNPNRGSSSRAKERLQFILVHDRIHLPPERMEQMKREILDVISKYVDIDGDNVDIALQKRERSSFLVAEVPFTKPAPYMDDDTDVNPPTASPDAGKAADDA
jgi:cell division topological specificity factor